MDMYMDLFNKMNTTCFEKCAHKKFKVSDLSLGEMSCADRCVSKYLEAQEKIGIILNKANEEQAELMRSKQEMQQAYSNLSK